jgi:hypothetical protein
MSRKKATEALEDGADKVVSPEAGAFIKRLIEDADLRETVGRALESSRSAYERVAKARKPGKLLDDKKLQADVQEALEAFRTAASGLAGDARKAGRKGRRRGRKLMIVLIGGGLALAGSEDLRSKVLDTLFGAEEEFEYTPPATAPSAPVAPAPEAAADAPADDGAA